MNAKILLTIEKEKLEKLKPVFEDFKAVSNAEETQEGKFKVEFV